MPDILSKRLTDLSTSRFVRGELFVWCSILWHLLYFHWIPNTCFSMFFLSKNMRLVTECQCYVRAAVQASILRSKKSCPRNKKFLWLFMSKTFLVTGTGRARGPSSNSKTKLNRYIETYRNQITWIAHVIYIYNIYIYIYISSCEYLYTDLSSSIVQGVHGDFNFHWKRRTEDLYADRDVLAVE